jgi:hypothetical protein
LGNGNPRTETVYATKLVLGGHDAIGLHQTAKMHEQIF